MVKESDLNPAKAQYGPPTHSTIFQPVCLVTFKQVIGINSPEPYKRVNYYICTIWQFNQDANTKICSF